MHESEQALRAKLENAHKEITESNFAKNIFRLSILESTGEIMVGVENEEGIPFLRKLSALNQPLKPKESADTMIYKLDGAQELIPTSTYYKHYKSDSMIYEVTRLAILEDTGEVMVGYDAQYGEMLPFERTYSSFTDYIKTDKGLVERFQEYTPPPASA